jgi:hypothetical protein
MINDNSNVYKSIRDGKYFSFCYHKLDRRINSFGFNDDGSAKTFKDIQGEYNNKTPSELIENKEWVEVLVSELFEPEFGEVFQLKFSFENKEYQQTGISYSDQTQGHGNERMYRRGLISLKEFDRIYKHYYMPFNINSNKDELTSSKNYQEIISNSNYNTRDEELRLQADYADGSYEEMVKTAKVIAGGKGNDWYRYVWTTVDTDNGLYLIAGVKTANRMDWYFSEKPWGIGIKEADDRIFLAVTWEEQKIKDSDNDKYQRRFLKKGNCYDE